MSPIDGNTGAAPGRIPWFRAVVLLGLLAVGADFVWRYVFRYYLNYDETAFTDPVRGASNYWAMRGWLMLHATCGTIAILVGPSQFWTGLRRRAYRLHRALGQVFLWSVVIGSIAGFRMAIGTSFGWASAFGTAALDAAWLSTTLVAYAAVVARRIQVHREWMTRAYIVTFSFALSRFLNEYGPTAALKPDEVRNNVFLWAAWVLPLLAAELWFQLRALRSAARATSRLQDAP